MSKNKFKQLQTLKPGNHPAKIASFDIIRYKEMQNKVAKLPWPSGRGQ